jgi:hypothetical protein
MRGRKTSCARSVQLPYKSNNETGVAQPVKAIAVDWPDEVLLPGSTCRGAIQSTIDLPRVCEEIRDDVHEARGILNCRTATAERPGA